MADAKRGQGQSAGPAIDRQGSPVVDPTENVKALSEAAGKRQDDLREKDKEISDIKHEHQKEMAALRSECEHGQAALRSQLADAEAKRIDAIRAVDVNAVAVASERQAAAAQVLANQVAQSADALRTLVSTTATATAEQNRQQLAQITDRLSVVEKSQYEGRGKESYTDPMLTKLSAEMERMMAIMSSNTGKAEATKDYTGYIIAAIGILFALASYLST